MQPWNIIVTTRPVPESESHVLQALHRFGEFGRSAFKDVCLGKAENTFRLLEQISFAWSEDATWTHELARVIPLETTFRFSPETLTGQLKEHTAGFVDRMVGGTFYVRLERRGLASKVSSREVERSVADHLFDLAERQGKHLRTNFSNPDYIVLAETVGDECGVALLHKALLEKYPFIQPR